MTRILRPTGTRLVGALVAAVLGLGLALGVVVLTAGTATATVSPAGPVTATVTTTGIADRVPALSLPQADGDGVSTTDGGTPAPTIDVGGVTDKPSTPLVLLLGITALSLAPAILLTCTSFTKVLVVLSLTRNALGLQQTPPNQVLAGLALFLSLFIMWPTASQVWEVGVEPYLNDGVKVQTAVERGGEPLKEFMLEQTGKDEIVMLTKVAKRDMPETKADTPFSTLVPAFVLSELKEAFIIGFVIFVPFLVIDIVVSAALMSLGMMMMPPVMVSLPFKLLLFVLVDGWGLIVTALVTSYG